MKYIIPCVLIIVLIIAIAVILLSKRRTATQEVIESANAENLNNELMLTNKDNQEITIQVDTIPADIVPASDKLMEITDSKILARVNSLVPDLVQAGNAINNVAKSAKVDGEVLYRAIIPNGAKLTNSRDMAGAVRGIYHNADGIRGHANLVAVQAEQGTEMLANATSAAMNVASMVVGQYYMSQINAELAELNESISKISDFQDNEYKARVFSLISHVKNISDFQIEIIENNDLRISKINQLDSLEKECTQLLTQANITLKRYSEKNELSYSDYEKATYEVESWHSYQRYLLEILRKIGELKYTLFLGQVSRQQCESMLSTYVEQVTDANSFISNWHTETTERLGIDIQEMKRKRMGLNGAMYFIPGLFKDELNFKAIDENTANLISTQTNEDINATNQSSELYSEDVQLIAKDGKIYYLPEAE